MTDFSLHTVWQIPAPVETVWPWLIRTETWPGWWRYVASVTELEAGTADGLFNKRRYIWRTCLPYELNLVMTVVGIQPLQAVTVEVAGDLSGTGRCRVAEVSDRTRVEFLWQVKTCKAWMNRLGGLARPVFEWNHGRVMKQGERGLIEQLSALKNRPRS
ncbi:MAG: SRPBCC family protein [Gammaproteobacteria bacterium]